MNEAAIDTLAGLKSYFFDAVFYAHKKDYPAEMTRAEFAHHLEQYREGMNDNQECSFPAPNEEEEDKLYADYLAEVRSRG